MTSSPLASSNVTLPAMLEVVICATDDNVSVSSATTSKNNLFCIEFGNVLIN
jgi:hypothetical protein